MLEALGCTSRNYPQREPLTGIPAVTCTAIRIRAPQSSIRAASSLTITRYVYSVASVICILLCRMHSSYVDIYPYPSRYPT